MTPPPSSRPPAGIPNSGNAKYGLIAAAFVAATGGLFAWRSCSQKTDAVAVAPSATALVPSASASAPVNPKLEDIPPPPEPEEKPATGGGAARSVVVGTSGGCEGKCTGTAPPDLERALQVRAGQARRCYNQALAQDSTLKGHVSITVRVGPSGNVCSTNVASNDMGTAAVANCAANVFRTSSGYPSPHGGCIDVTVPLQFKPQGQ